MKTKKTIAAPGLEAMLASLGAGESGHPGEGWFSASEIAETVGFTRFHVKTKCDRLVALGTYEKCQRKIGGHNTTFYRLKEVLGKCSQKAETMKRPVQSSPLARSLPSKTKRAGKR